MPKENLTLLYRLEYMILPLNLSLLKQLKSNKDILRGSLRLLFQNPWSLIRIVALTMTLVPFWFMAFFVDAYDWVMVPNIYAMSQYADGGKITTKPYISGANYILKMSDYKKDPWVDIWDGLFWRFMQKHQDLFKSNPRTAVLLGHLETNASAIFAKIASSEKWLSQQVLS